MRENVSKKEECSVEDNDDDDVNISILPDLVLSLLLTTCVCKPATSVSPGSLSEIHNLWPHLK